MHKFLYEQEGIRRFSSDSVQANIDKVLATVPEDKSGAILDVDLGPDGVRAVVAARLDDKWSIGLVGSYSGKRAWGVGTRVRFVW